MKATFVTTKENFSIVKINKRLDIKDGELIEIQITKLHIDETLRKEIVNLLKDQRNIEHPNLPSA